MEFADERIKKNFKRSQMNVQDPFELAHNTAANVGEKCVSRFRRQFAVTLAKLKVATVNLAGLCGGEDERANSVAGKSQAGAADLTVHVPLSTAPVREETAKAAVERLLIGVLKFEPRAEPDFKRKRMGDDKHSSSSQFDVEHRLWQGRRGKRREVERAHPEFNEFDAELEVSRLLLLDQQQKPPADRRKLLALRVDVESGSDAVDVHFRRIEGADVDFHNLSHFLDTFLKKFVPHLLLAENDAMEM